MKKQIFFLSVFLIFVLLFVQSNSASDFKLVYYYKVLKGNSDIESVSLNVGNNGSLDLVLNSEESVIIHRIADNGVSEYSYSFSSETGKIKAVSSVKDGNYDVILASSETLCKCANYGLIFKISGSEVVWSKTFFIGLDVIPKKIVLDYKGNYLVLGSSKIAGRGYDLVLLYLDPNGGLLWYKIFGTNWNEYPEDLIAVLGDEYLILAREEGPTNGLLLVNLATNGNLKWSKLIQIELSGGVFASINIESKYFIVGNTGSSAFMFFVDKNGVVHTPKVFSEESNIKLYHLSKFSGGFVAVGRVISLNEKAFILKLDEYGSLLGSYVISKPINTVFKASSQVLVYDVFLGDHLDKDVFILKTNKDLSLPVDDLFLSIIYPLRDLNIAATDIEVTNINQDIYYANANVTSENYPLTEGDVVILQLDPNSSQTITRTARIGTTITVTRYYNTTTIYHTISTTDTITVTQEDLSTETTFVEQSTTRTSTLTSTVSKPTFNIMDPIVLGTLLFALLLGIGIALLIRRL